MTENVERMVGDSRPEYKLTRIDDEYDMLGGGLKIEFLWGSSGVVRNDKTCSYAEALEIRDILLELYPLDEVEQEPKSRFMVHYNVDDCHWRVYEDFEGDNEVCRGRFFNEKDADLFKYSLETNEAVDEWLNEPIDPFNRLNESKSDEYDNIIAKNLSGWEDYLKKHVYTNE